MAFNEAFSVSEQHNGHAGLWLGLLVLITSGAGNRDGLYFMVLVGIPRLAAAWEWHRRRSHHRLLQHCEFPRLLPFVLCTVKPTGNSVQVARLG